MIEFWSHPCCESPVTLERSFFFFFFFLLTSKSFICKTWRMIWLQLHGSKARTNQVVSSCGSVDEPHVPLGPAEELALVSVTAQPSPGHCFSTQSALVTGSWHRALRGRFSWLGEQKGSGRRGPAGSWFLLAAGLRPRPLGSYGCRLL